MTHLRPVLAIALVIGLSQAMPAEAQRARAGRNRIQRVATALRARVRMPRLTRRIPVYRRPFQKDPTIVRPKTPGQKRFAVIGDSGSAGPIQAAVASQMAKVFGKRPFESLVMLGDNVYENGEPHKMPRAIVGAYGRLFKKGVRALPTLGNHDVRSEEGNAQLKYYGLGKRRFYKTPLAQGQVELFSVDTTLMLPQKDYYPKAWRSEQASAQRKWLAKSLASSKAQYKIVIGHHPMYSSGGAGPDEMQVRKEIEGLLRANGVSAYLSGHHHHYERSKPQGGITHFVSGAGGKDSWRKGLDQPNPQRVTGAKGGQFMLFEMKKGQLHFESIGTEGQVLDRGVLSAPANSQGR